MLLLGWTYFFSSLWHWNRGGRVKSPSWELSSRLERLSRLLPFLFMSLYIVEFSSSLAATPWQGFYFLQQLPVLWQGLLQLFLYCGKDCSIFLYFGKDCNNFCILATIASFICLNFFEFVFIIFYISLLYTVLQKNVQDNPRLLLFFFFTFVLHFFICFHFFTFVFIVVGPLPGPTMKCVCLVHP